MLAISEKQDELSKRQRDIMVGIELALPKTNDSRWVALSWICVWIVTCFQSPSFFKAYLYITGNFCKKIDFEGLLKAEFIQWFREGNFGSCFFSLFFYDLAFIFWKKLFSSKENLFFFRKGGAPSQEAWKHMSSYQNGSNIQKLSCFEKTKRKFWINDLNEDDAF